jgi:hypothetical protein|nr:MAG TPA: Heat shock factor-binding protein 1 helix, Nucleus, TRANSCRIPTION.8A [Caudoviricetes sp.]
MEHTLDHESRLSRIEALLEALNQRLDDAILTQLRDHGKRIRDLEDHISVMAETCARERGERQGSRAIAALVSSGVFVSVATGRSSVLVAGSGKSTGRVDRPPVSYQTGHGCPQLKRKRAPWEYDLAHSTRPEEEEKRGHESFLREQEERRPNGGCDDGCTI